VGCVVTDPAQAAHARRIFGPRHMAAARHAGELARVLLRLMG
jgi:hypothetical protein